MIVSKDKIQNITKQLFDYCRSNNWAGYDPYDALNSELFKRLPFLNFWLPRLGMTQILKRSPINFRPLLLIPKTQNPKALGLFLTAMLKLEKAGLLEDKTLIPSMIQNIIALRSPESTISAEIRRPASNHYFCWGYSFPWQGRSVLAPRGAPNLVCTVFVANALLDVYESSRNVDCLTMAASSAEYLLNELFWSEDNAAGFSYPVPTNKTKVHNANFLGAALFCRICKLTGENKFLEPALKAACYSSSRQHPDGGWDYGEHEKQQWMDNFHTGFNLGALKTIKQYAETDEFEPNVRIGFKFYKDNFFREDGAPKYYHNNTYPLDIHSVAQSIITLMDFSDLDPSNIELAYRVFDWAIQNMWDEKGYFYYQISPWYKNKIPYMRWSQAWMLLALATLLQTTEH